MHHWPRKILSRASADAAEARIHGTRISTGGNGNPSHALEGNGFTLPEVRTLLEGVTVGGKKLEDEQQIIALSEAYNRLDEMVNAGQFSLSKDVSDELNRLVVPGTEHGPGGTLLRDHLAGRAQAEDKPAARLVD